MPFVNIQITREGNVTPEQKAELIKGATELLQRVLNKNPETTFVIIDEVDTNNWGVGASRSRCGGNASAQENRPRQANRQPGGSHSGADDCRTAYSASSTSLRTPVFSRMRAR